MLGCPWVAIARTCVARPGVRLFGPGSALVSARDRARLPCRSSIPQRSDQTKRWGRRRLDRAAYKERARLEPCVGWLKENRRVGTRYDKLASSFHAFVNLAIIRRYLRRLAPAESSDRTPNGVGGFFMRVSL